MTPLWVPIVVGALGVIVGALLVVGVAAVVDEAHRRLADDAEQEMLEDE